MSEGLQGSSLSLSGAVEASLKSTALLGNSFQGVCQCPANAREMMHGAQKGLDRSGLSVMLTIKTSLA